MPEGARFIGQTNMGYLIIDQYGEERDATVIGVNLDRMRDRYVTWRVNLNGDGGPCFYSGRVFSHISKAADDFHVRRPIRT